MSVKTWLCLIGYLLLNPHVADVNCQGVFSVDVGGFPVPCPLENVTFTCTVSSDGIDWSFTPNRREVLTNNGQVPTPVSEVFPGVFANLIAFNSSFLTGRLIAEASVGFSVTCSDFPGARVIGTHTIASVVVPASSPLNVVHTVASFLSNGAMVELSWDPPTSNGGRAVLSYILVSSLAAEGLPAIVTNTSRTFIASYGVRYTVGVITQNCAGNSTAQEIVITVCRPDASFSTGGAVGITVAVAAVVFTAIGFSLGVLFMWLLAHCKKPQSLPSNDQDEMKEISKE